jgi:hypothetical protein
VQHAATAEYPRALLPDGAEEKRAAFETTLNEFVMRRRQQESQLLLQYRHGLAELRRNVQQEGNYEGVISVDKALDEYVQSNLLGEPRENDIEDLVSLKRAILQIREEQALISARQIVTAAKKYTAALDELRKGYTQKGEMEIAGRISAELQRVKALPVITENEALLAKMATSNNGAFAGATMPAVGPLPELEELGNIRDALRIELDRLEREATETLADWPQQYLAALRTLMEAFRQSGNFNAWEAASSELARFEETMRLRQEDILEFPEELHQTQETFLSQRRIVMDSCDADKRTVYRNYLSKLEQLKSNLTKQGQMNAASTVNQVIRMIQTEPRYLALERGSAGVKKTPVEATEKAKPRSTDPQE